MCKRIHLLKYCFGCGPTTEWAFDREQKCKCGISEPEDIFRQPHPYMTFTCEDCQAKGLTFETSTFGRQWIKEHGIDLKVKESKGMKATRKATASK